MSVKEQTVAKDTASDAASSTSSEPCGELALTARVEALLVSTDRPLSEARMAALLGIDTKGAAKRVVEAIEQLNDEYARTERVFRAERLAGGWQLLTRADLGPLLTRLHAERQQSRLSQAALETLAIVAYRQPLMRAELEAIRGVACGEVLRGLLERRLVKITGRAEELGRPMLYGTTTEFLNVFGLASLDDLPDVEGLQRREPQPAATPSTADRPSADADRETDAADDAVRDEGGDPSGEPGDG